MLEDHVGIVMEIMPFGSIKEIKGLMKGSIKFPLIYHWAYQASEAVAYLERKKIIHADINTANVMVDEEWNAKLGDLGLSRMDSIANYYSKSNRCQQGDNYGVVACIAPERLRNMRKVPTSKETDRYALVLGFIINELEFEI